MNGPFTVVAVKEQAFLSHILKSTYKTMGYSGIYNRAHECYYLDWLFENVDDDDFAFVYTASDMVVDLRNVWSGVLRAILFKNDDDAVLFKLSCGDLIGK